MNGPVKLFGTSTYGGVWELTGRCTDAFGAIALPAEDIRPTAGYSHAQPFDEWLARYFLTGEKKDLERACELADQYIRSQVRTPPARDLGPQPFFYISFVPDWEGLLRLYEVTKRKEYLEAAAFGAATDDGHLDPTAHPRRNDHGASRRPVRGGCQAHVVEGFRALPAWLAEPAGDHAGEVRPWLDRFRCRHGF